jgi:2-isopropylmalate synthase
MALLEDRVCKAEDIFKLDYINVVAGNKTVPTATVKVEKEGRVLQEAACGNGPVDATYKAIDRITGIKCELLDYSIKAISSQTDAMGEVRVKIRFKDKVVSGTGTSTDIIEASAKAYINAINKGLHLWEKQR